MRLVLAALVLAATLPAQASEPTYFFETEVVAPLDLRPRAKIVRKFVYGSRAVELPWGGLRPVRKAQLPWGGLPDTCPRAAGAEQEVVLVTKG